MNSAFSYTVSIILALGFHAAVLGLLVKNWDDQQLITSLPTEQYYIDANLVEENPFEARKREEAARKNQERIRRTESRKAAENKTRLRKEAIELAKRKDLEKQLAEQKALEEARAKADAKTDQDHSETPSTTEAERKMMEQSLALSVREEQQMRRAVTDDEKAMAYVSQIQRDIVGNWSRPPSARNGMQALLRVFLVPTGEVVNVIVEESSGNDAFDRSALLAVRKSEKFQVPVQSRQFERDFREFTVLFRPEDLRL